MSQFFAPSIFAESSFRHQPQRGCGSKPKVGAHAPTLGERGKTEATATRLWPASRARWTERMDATALRLRYLLDDHPG